MDDSPVGTPVASPDRKKAADSDSDVDSFNSFERGERPFDPKKDCPPLPSKPEDVDYVTDDEEDIPYLSDKLRNSPCLRLIRKILSKRCHLENFRADAQYQANIDIINSNDKNAADILEHFMWYTRKYGQMDGIGEGDPVTVVAAKLPSPEYSGHYRRTILIALKTVGANFDIPGNDGETAVELMDEEEYADIIRAAEQKNRWDAGEGGHY